MKDRYEKSRVLLERATNSLTGGVSSPFRAKFPVPLFAKDAQGSHLWDEDGNEYIDYVLAWGPLILGHRHPAIVEAVRRNADRPHIYGVQHRLEAEVAERMQQLIPCADRVLFTSSGSEAVQIALRLVRAFTGRNLIVKFEGHYHGWMDPILLSYRASLEQLGPVDAPRVVLGSRGQVPNAVDNVVTASWNDFEAVEKIFSIYGNSIAAVITEPVLCNSGSAMPEPGFLQALRSLTQQHGALLIFDEIITGMRMGLGGAQAAFGVTPDIATFGKALAGGLTLSAVAGRADILEQIMAAGVAFGGTFNGNPLSLAAAAATMDELSREDGSGLSRANELGLGLMQGLRCAAKEQGIPVVISGFGAAFSIHFSARPEIRCYRDNFEDDREALSRFLRLALDEGLFLLPDGRWYVSAAHTAQDIETSLSSARRALAAMACALA